MFYMSKRVELFSYRFACEYCGHITPWITKTGTSNLSEEDTPSEDRFQAEDFAAGRHRWNIPHALKTPLTIYKRAYAEGKYYILDSSIKCPSCHKVQHWSWNPNQTPKSLLDGLWLWAGLFVVLMLIGIISSTLITIMAPVSDIKILLLMYGAVPLGLSFALAVAATSEANNVYHKNLHDFETVKAKNVPEVRWLNQGSEDMSIDMSPGSEHSRRMQRAPKNPPPLWESLSANQNLLGGPRLALPPAQAEGGPSARRLDTFGRNTPPQNMASQENSIQDSLYRINAAREEAAREGAFAREGTAREAAVREEAVREAAAREEAAREAAVREAAREEFAARGIATRGTMAREATNKGIAARGAAAREAAIRGYTEESTDYAGSDPRNEPRQFSAQEAASRMGNRTAGRAVGQAAGRKTNRTPDQMTGQTGRLNLTDSSSPDDNKIASIWEASGLTEASHIPETTTKRRKIFSRDDQQEFVQQGNKYNTTPDRYQPTSWTSPPQRDGLDDISARKHSQTMNGRTQSPDTSRITLDRMAPSPDRMTPADRMTPPSNRSSRPTARLPRIPIQAPVPVSQMPPPAAPGAVSQAGLSRSKSSIAARNKLIQERAETEKTISEKIHRNSPLERARNKDDLREHSLRGSSPKEKSMRGDSLNERSIRNDSLNERSIRNNSLNERSLRNDSLNERSIRDNSLNERSLRNDSLNERSIRNNSLNERTLSRDRPLVERPIRGKPPLTQRSRESSRVFYDVELAEVGGDIFNIMQTVREITGLSFKETQNLVETVPRILLSDVSQATANSIKAKFNRLDAVINIHAK